MYLDYACYKSGIFISICLGLPYTSDSGSLLVKCWLEKEKKGEVGVSEAG